MGLAFMIVRHLSYHLLFLFYMPCLHIHIWTQLISAYFVNFFPCWFKVCGKSHHLALIVYHLRDQTKTQRCAFVVTIREVILVLQLQALAFQRAF